MDFTHFFTWLFQNYLWLFSKFGIYWTLITPHQNFYINTCYHLHVASLCSSHRTIVDYLGKSKFTNQIEILTNCEPLRFLFIVSLAFSSPSESHCHRLPHLLFIVSVAFPLHIQIEVSLFIYLFCYGLVAFMFMGWMFVGFMCLIGLFWKLGVFVALTTGLTC